MTKFVVARAALGIFAVVSVACAQQPTAPAAATTAAPTIKRTPLQRFDVPGSQYETVIGMAEIVPNVNIGRHTHPGPESGYMIEGDMVLLIDGQPERLVKTGESYQVPAGAIHDARSGARGAKVVATYVVEKGKPLAAPAK